MDGARGPELFAGKTSGVSAVSETLLRLKVKFKLTQNRRRLDIFESQFNGLCLIQRLPGHLFSGNSAVTACRRRR